jgi:RNA polymerase sigma-70 factor (ECF subfamily)
MTRAQAGDRDAYRALLDDVGPMIAQFLRKRLPDASEVDDAYQETFIALHRARHTYDPTRPLEPWLFAIARNIATDFLRRRRRRALREVLTDVMPEAAAEPERDLRGQFSAVLGSLPRSQREALVMLKVDGLSVTEAATRAGTTPGALKVRAHRAYTALKARLRS